MLIFITSKTSSMYVKVLILVLSLMLTFKPFKVFDVLFFESQLETRKFDNFLLIVMNGLRHTVFLTLDNEKFHFNCLLDI